jgi:hypothetical protein
MTTRRRGLKLQVVAPCSEDWNAMPGGDDVRFCGKCRQNVYNLSAMTETQARDLVQGPVCVRFFHRGDGTVITRKCPPMLEAARRRLIALAAGVLPAAVGFWGSLAWLRGLVHGRPDRRELVAAVGSLPQPVEPPPLKEEPPRVLMGAPPPPPPRMGKPKVPKAKKRGRASMGQARVDEPLAEGE